MKHNLWLALMMALVLTACTTEQKQNIKQGARDVGHTAREATREVGHATRDATRETGHFFRDTAKEVFGDGKSSGTDPNASKDKKDEKAAEESEQ